MRPSGWESLIQDGAFQPVVWHVVLLPKATVIILGFLARRQLQKQKSCKALVFEGLALQMHVVCVYVYRCLAEEKQANLWKVLYFGFFDSQQPLEINDA